MNRELPIPSEENDVMDPFDLADHQIHTVVDEHAPDEQYPTYEEDAKRGLEIERARRIFVRETLRSPFMLRKVANIQKNVYERMQQKRKGEHSDDPGLSFDRHIRISETEGITEESAQQNEFTEDAIKERMQEVIPKLLHLIACDETDRRELLQDNISATERALLKKMIAERERTMIGLAYSIPVRMDRVLTPLLKTFRGKNSQIEVMQSHANSIQREEDLERLSEELLQTPEQCRKTMSRINAAHQRYAKSLHALVEPHLRIAFGIAHRYHRRQDWNKIELRSAGFIGLMRAAELYEHRKGCKFNTYAQGWIQQGIRRERPEIYNMVHIPPHAADAIRTQIEIFQEKYHRLPIEKKQDDIAFLSEGSGFSEELVRSILLFRHVTSLNILLSNRSHGDDYIELGDTIPDESQPSPIQITIEKEIEDHVHEVLRSTPIFHRIMFKLRRGLRLRDYELPGTEKIFPERSLVRILIKIRNGFPLTEKEIRIFQECNSAGDNRKVGLSSPLGPAEQLEDPPEGYLGSLNVEASTANKRQGKPTIIETVPIFDHAEKNSDKEAGYTLEIVAAVCGVTRERVRQLEKTLMKKLQDPVRLPRLKALFTHEQEELTHSEQE